MFRTNKTPVLQEKSASGSVASFNTALAMPLSSCNIAVNAWQEGSGDPSPSNVRPIHGFSEVNATRAGKNLLEKPVVRYSNSLNKFSSCFFLKAGTYILNIKSIENATKWRFAFIIYNSDGSIDREVSITSTPAVYWSTNRYINNNDQVDKRQRITFSKDVYVRFFLDYGDVTSSTIIGDSQLEQGTNYTSYEPYTGNIYTIQLGQEVYGAEVDAVNGVAHCTHELITDLSNADWTYNPNQCFSITTIKGLTDGEAFMCNKYLAIGYESLSNMGDNRAQLRTIGLYIKDLSYNGDVNAFKASLADIQICKLLATPFDIQLTPTQIQTLIGNNTIFADTGDVDLTYKDLDIAKRGSFREVFKLPS